MQKVSCNWMECDVCQHSDVTIITSSEKPDWYYDGDPIVCNFCQTTGEVYVDDGIAFPVWEGVE